MLQEKIKSALVSVGQALRKPEDFAAAWHREEAHYGWLVWAALIVTSILGTTTYGMTLGILGGSGEVMLSAFRLTVAAGLAWAIPLPALYILNSLTGSKLTLGTTFLAAIVTTSWGGLALVASIPINWFFTVAIPVPWFVRLENIVVFTGVGVAMVDVFGRILEWLEPRRGRLPAWSLLLVGAIGLEFFHAFRLFEFAVRATE